MNNAPVRNGRTELAAAVLFGALLVFQVQPIAGRFLLPAFGGGAAVWTACMFFFQLALLAGYAYAYALTRRAPPRRQAMIHASLLAVSTLFLPLGFTLGDDVAANPGIRIALALTVSIGIPFTVLAGTAPLMQRWYSFSGADRSPYHLYALSNAGALLALLSYPLLIEPALPLATQTLLWSGAYVVFLAASLLACLRTWRRTGDTAVQPQARSIGRFSPVDATAIVALSAGGVVLLLAVTNQITQNVAPIPFLWVLPLVVYLLTWIATFSGERFYDRSIWASLFVVCACCMILLEYFATSFGIVPVIVTYLLVLGCACIVCHGEIYRLRPRPGLLGHYYLLIAAGGALGGALVSVVAPLVFDRYWEGLAGIFLVYLVFGALVLRDFRRERDAPLQHNYDAVPLPLLRWMRRLFAAGWALGILLFPAAIAAVHSLLPQDHIASARNFYGILNVRDDTGAEPPRRQLVDGTTIHGFQLLAAGLATVPTSYYARDTGIGRLLERFERDGDGLDMGIVGLGVGTLAAYGQPGDRLRFYELNPAVEAIARQHFTFLEDSAAEIGVVRGDARVSLERELAENGSRGYDLLVIDAFTSDAIPVHLLTREAHALYWSHLADDGVLAFHITNNYLDLGPVLANAAVAFGKRALLVTTEQGSDASSPTDWVLLHDADEPPQALPTVNASYLLPPLDEPLWTDDYSDLLGTFRR